jgi:hypothetical protein
MTDMLADLTKTVTRFNRYLSLLADNVELQRYLLLLYDDYVGFCVSALLFYKRISWCKYLSLCDVVSGSLTILDTIITMIWSTIKEEFEASKARIAKTILAFENEVRISVDEITVRGIAKIQQNVALSPSTNRIPGEIRMIPFSRNDFFVGREDELAKMHAILTLRHSDAPSRRNVCVIHSMGGVGKTQLAREYIARHESDYSYIFWLAAERGPEIARSFASIGRALCLSEESAVEAASLNRQVQTSREFLEQRCK